jgi:hypothetical protein
VGRYQQACLRISFDRNFNSAKNRDLPMRSWLLSFSVGVLAVSGCSSLRSVSVPEAVKDRFSGPTYHTYVVKADHRATYEAAKAALKPMDFRFLSGGPNQGKISAVGQINGGNDLQSSLQLQLEVRLATVPEGTEISALFSQVTEDDFDRQRGMAVSTPVKESGVYENYFQHVEEALASPAK